MKIKFTLTAIAFAGCAALGAATLNESTAVQSQPDPSSPVIAILKAGAEQPVPTDKGGPTPAGWSAVEIDGPFEGYVRNRDLTKQLDVRPGASIYLAPKSDAGLLAVFAKGDKAEITGLHGGWTQLRLDKTLVGYIHAGPAQPITSAPVAPEASVASNAAAAPASPASSATSPAAVPSGDNASLSRLFEGTLASTKSLFAPKRPYAWQLVDASGTRIAYVDLTNLLLTEQIDSYSGHGVVVLGSMQTVKDSKDLVIEVEGLRLK
jgi:hypothetical protein